MATSTFGSNLGRDSHFLGISHNQDAGEGTGAGGAHRAQWPLGRAPAALARRRVTGCTHLAPSPWLSSGPSDPSGLHTPWAPAGSPLGHGKRGADLKCLVLPRLPQRALRIHGTWCPASPSNPSPKSVQPRGATAPSSPKMGERLLGQRL